MVNSLKLLDANYNHYLNTEQKLIVAHKQGPLRVIAGPGTGKTHSLTLLAMNLLLRGDAQPSEIVLCTYTEKAAYGLQDRLNSFAKKIDYTEDLSQIRIGTIHGICQQLVDAYLPQTSLTTGYEVLDEFHQHLLVFDHLAGLCPGNLLPFLRDRWLVNNWKIAKTLTKYCNIIAEELILENLQQDKPRLASLRTVPSDLLYYLTDIYERYQRLLINTNQTDFAHLEQWAYTLLNQPEILSKITSTIRYVLVDEYQDTNYIQEQILIQLASGSEPKNMIVIGDDDQALYRFRGATVRNLRDFDTETFSGCPTIRLDTNYRSQKAIITVCRDWIEDFNWSGGKKGFLRIPKALEATRESSYKAPAVMHFAAESEQDEAEQFAELVAWLKKQGKITDYSDVALLLSSVKIRFSGPYIAALRSRDIPVYCPRAGVFFLQPEIKRLFGCFAQILHYTMPEDDMPADENPFPAYLTACQNELREFARRAPLAPLVLVLQKIEKEIQGILEQNGRINGQHLSEYFYQLLSYEPFYPWKKQDDGNLAQFSRLLDTFQKRYSHQAHSTFALADLSTSFFTHFFAFLYDEGLGEEEDQQRPFLKGHVQIMTIHQAKGLEFPVVVLGKLEKPPRKQSVDERARLQPYFYYQQIEPQGRIPGCDRRRLYYVALSRAKDLLVLSAVGQPHTDFLPIWQKSQSWQESCARPNTFPEYESLGDLDQIKPRYGITTHIQTYQTCPRRYRYMYKQRFAPAHHADGLFGQLVHQTIERLHRQTLADPSHQLDEAHVQKIFDTLSRRLQHTSVRPLTPQEEERARQQVLNYCQQNQQMLSAIHAAEFPVQIDRDDYVLRGKVDLLVNGKQGLEVIDFKTQPRPTEDSAYLAAYRQQLQLYAYALPRHLGQSPRRLWLYWTAEEQRANALMEISCDQNEIAQVVRKVDNLAEKIRLEQFDVKTRPQPTICQKCDIRHLCKKDGILQI